eukprot:scaffold143130_cov36-Prasinocladus_malaysianus.AAC.1
MMTGNLMTRLASMMGALCVGNPQGLAETSLAVQVTVNAQQLPVHRFNSDMREALMDAVAAESGQKRTDVCRHRPPFFVCFSHDE